MLALAALVAFCIYFFYARHRKFPSEDAVNFFIICLISGLAGALLLHIAMTLPGLIADWKVLVAPLPLKEAVEAVSQRLGGMVFYGGFIGAVLGVLIYTKLAKVPLLQYADLLVPVVPIAHAIGRVGCLLGGCCYGVQVAPSNPLSIVYPACSLGAPAGVHLLAVPPIESCCNLLIAGVLFLYSKHTSTPTSASDSGNTDITLKNRVPGRVVALYALLYAPVRFILEFFRGDEIRGVYDGISTSQIISIVVFAGAAALFFAAPKLKDRALAAWEEYEHKQASLAELRVKWKETHKK